MKMWWLWRLRRRIAAWWRQALVDAGLRKPDVLVTQHRRIIRPLPFDQERLKQLTGRDMVSRNSPCICGSGKRFKRCHGDKKRRGF